MTRYLLILATACCLTSCAELLQMLEAVEQSPQSESQSTPQSQPQAVKTFAQMDANSDGKLSSSEAEGTVKESFTKLDSNKDGFLSQKEVEGSTSRRTDKRPGGK